MVALSSKPTGKVQIHTSIDFSAEAEVKQGLVLEFNATNWDVSQTVSVH